MPSDVTLQTAIPNLSSAQTTRVEPRSAPPTQMPAQGLEEPVYHSPPMGERELSQAVERLNELSQTVKRELEFSVDEESGRSVIRVIDQATGETIRQFPPEEVLSVIRHFEEGGSGLVRKQV